MIDKRLQLLADNVREIFWVLDPSTKRVLYLNAAFERITGVDIDDLYADPTSWRSLLHPRDRPRIEEELEQRNAAGEPHNLEGRIVRPDGEVRWVWMRGVPVRDANGASIVGVVEDITERKRAEEHLERSISLLRATLHATADGILAVDDRGRVTAFNSRFVELWRIPDFAALEAGEAESLWRHILTQLQRPEPFRQRLSEVSGRPKEDSFDVLDLLDGRIYEAYSRPRHVGDQPDGRVWSFRDTTGRTVAERELQERTRRLGKRNEVLLELARQRITNLEDGRKALTRITRAAAEVLETARTGIWLFESGHDTIRQIELFDSRTRSSAGKQVLKREDAPSYFAALEKERALAIEDVRADHRAAGRVRAYCAEHNIVSLLDAPLRIGGRIVGVVCFEQVERPRRWTVEDENFAGSIADLIANTLDAIERRRTQNHMEFLAKASAILSSSLEYRTTIDHVAQLAIPTLADWCLVDLIEDGSVLRVVSRHADPGKEEILRELGERYPPQAGAARPAGEALRTGKAELVSEVTPEILAERSQDEDHRRLLEQLGLGSYMAVPLRARDRTLGVITFASGERRFDEHDLALAQDLADRAAMAIDNALLFEESQVSNRAKSNFLAVMSHELRTPLTAVMGFTDIVLSGISGPLTDTQREQLEIVKLRSQDLVRIIDEILTFAQTDTGSEQPVLTRVDLSDLLRGVAAEARPLVQSAGLEFVSRLPDQPLWLVTDAKRLQQIVLNLVTNAVHFTHEGSVELSASVDGDHVSIRIADTGIGIGRDDQDRIFEPFVQVEDVMTREKGGTGLGLAVARRLTHLLGGEINVESVPGEGSTFTIELPYEST